MLSSSDIDVLAHSCWGISHLCDGPKSSFFIKQLVDAKISTRLVDLLNKKSMKVVKPALRAVGNIVCVEDEVFLSCCYKVKVIYSTPLLVE